MKKFKAIIAGAALGVAALVLTAAVNNGSYYGPPGTIFDSTSGTTNIVQSYPQAMGTNVVGTSLLWSDVTNLVEIPIGTAKDLSLEFTAAFAGGTGGSGSTSNAVLRFVYTDRNLAKPLTTTNAVSAYTYAQITTWTIPVTIAAGVGSVDVMTNFGPTVAPPAPSTSHGHWYLYGIQWGPVTNAAAFMTNYHLYWNAK